MGSSQEQLEQLMKQEGKGKDWPGSGKSQEWQGENRQNDCSTPTWKGTYSIKGSSNSSIYSVDGADIDWWAQSDRPQHSSQSEEEIYFCVLSESEVQSQRHRQFKTVQRKHRPRRGVNTHNRCQTLSILETMRDEDEAEEPPIFVFEKSDNGKWIREEVDVDSRIVECETSMKIMPHLRVS